jgi:hypothetical protein
MSQVIVHRHAARYLSRLPAPQKEKIKSVLRHMSITSGQEGMYTKNSLFSALFC